MTGSLIIVVFVLYINSCLSPFLMAPIAVYRYYTHYFTYAHFGYGTGPAWLNYVQCNGTEQDIDECYHYGWYENSCSHSYDVGVTCESYRSEYTTESYMTEITTQASNYESMLVINCGSSNWDIQMYLPNMYNLHPDFDVSDIYLGIPTCQGSQYTNYLYFRQYYGACDTKQTKIGDNIVYTNTLVYAVHERNNPHIIREYRFRISTECDMSAHETVTKHLVQNHSPMSLAHSGHVSGSGHYTTGISFYRDSSFRYLISGDPINVNIGDLVYVKMFAEIQDYDVKMRLDNCYTLPSQSASYNLRYFLIQNGCPTDSNVRIIYTATHETRFSFKDFEYSSNQDHLYVYCSAVFCNATDYSSMCEPTCHHKKKRIGHADTSVGRSTIMASLQLNHNKDTTENAEKASPSVTVSIVVGLVSLSVVVMVGLMIVRKYRKKHASTVKVNVI